MSNIQVFNPAANRPAFATKGELSAVTKALAGGGASGKRVSIKGGVFRLIADGKEVAAIDERYLDVVIVNAAPKVARTMYEGTYDDANAAAPICWSSDGVTPDTGVKSPCATSCATCPNNQKGSGQGDTRACRFSQRVAVVLANDIDGEVMQLSLPATSIFGKAEGDNRPLQDYARFHAAQGNDISMMVTRLKFDTAVATPKLFFKAMRWLEADEFETTSAKGASIEAIQAITLTVSQQDRVPPVAAAAPVALPGKKPVAAPVPAEDDEPPAPAPRRAAAPVVEEEPAAPAPKRARAKPAALPPEPEEDVPAPAVKKQAAPAPVASGNLASVLGDWDDEA